MTADPLLDYLEATFAEAYRKEIDQEENVWRSLPFFAATLALQLAGLAQVRDWTAGVQGKLFVAVAILLAVAAIATFGALVFLAYSVWPAYFRRVAPETEFRAYAERVRVTIKGGVPAGTSAESVAELALIKVKAAMAEQLAVAVERNRLVNAGRSKWRVLGQAWPPWSRCSSCWCLWRWSCYPISMLMANMDSTNSISEEPLIAADPHQLSEIPPPLMVVYYRGWFGDRIIRRSAVDLANEDRQRQERA